MPADAGEHERELGSGRPDDEVREHRVDGGGRQRLHVGRALRGVVRRAVQLGRADDEARAVERRVDHQRAAVHVVSRGVPPQLFRDRIGVVVEGTMTRNGTFQSRRLMVSHDNRYRAPGDKDVDVKTLMRSTQGLDEAPVPRAAATPAVKPQVGD